MTRPLRHLLAMGLLLVGVGCTQLKPSRCEQNSDCNSHSCNLTTFTCVAVDGGNTGGAGGSGGSSQDAGRDGSADKAPPPCSVDSCSGPMPVCDVRTGKCRAPDSDAECKQLDVSKPLYRTAGDSGTPAACVQCVQSTDCGDPRTPVCTLNVCSPCVSDTDCSRFWPGVCRTVVSTSDGGAGNHCANADETVYVSNSSKCSETAVAAAGDAGSADGGTQLGNAAHPFCSLLNIRAALSPTRNLVVISGEVSAGNWSYKNEAQSPLLVVGQSGSIAAAVSPAFQMAAGDVTIRNLMVSQSASVGIQADGGTLHLDHVKVTNCKKGGIQLDGANFDIHDTTVTGNMAGDYNGLVSWGGILETAVPASGPKSLSDVSVVDNTGQGITCVDMLNGAGVLAARNSGPAQISSNCGLTGCADAGAQCGAQPY